MQKKTRNYLIGFVLIIITVVGADYLFKKKFFESTVDRINSLLHLSKNITVKGDTQTILSPDFLKKYYSGYTYHKTWTDSAQANDKYRDMLLNMLRHADSLGLNRADYHQDYIQKFDSLSHLPNFDYSAYESENEVIFTDAALSFLYNVAYGKEIQIGYSGVKYNIDSARILKMFNELTISCNWRSTLDSIEPRTTQYLTLKKELNRMNAVLQALPGLDSIQVTAKLEDKNLVMEKLKAYGLINDSVRIDTIMAGPIPKQAIKDFQAMMSMDTTGGLDARTVAQLNFPLKERLKQLKESLNYWRWTGRLRENEFILVNIPAARLQLVKNDSAINLSMNVIVGKASTQTPSFTAYINKVITYPYWTVPRDISIKEMLPKIVQSIDYLDNNNLQVINNKGKIMAPEKVEWKKLSKDYFPYTIRQSTGCDNSLGVLKFELNSPYSIYLHDTNRRDLFGKKNRFMSHGCIRVEKPMELAGYILGNTLDSTLTDSLNMCLKNQLPREIPLKKPFPVLIFYMPADIDEKGHLKFYNDVYGIEEKKVA